MSDCDSVFICVRVEGGSRVCDAAIEGFQCCFSGFFRAFWPLLIADCNDRQEHGEREDMQQRPWPESNGRMLQLHPVHVNQKDTRTHHSLPLFVMNYLMSECVH